MGIFIFILVQKDRTIKRINWLGNRIGLRKTIERCSEEGMEEKQLQQALECLLFVACEPLSLKTLSAVLEENAAMIRHALQCLQEEYRHKGFHLREIAGGWQFVTDVDYAPLIEKLYRPRVQQLSAAAMETLAIIAYKQPIAKADIAAIRQVDVDGVVATLLEKNLIKEVGRLAGAGRAILYGTSEEFLSFFGLNSIEELPDILPLQTDTPASLFPAENAQ